MLKPMWSYGIQLWCCTKPTNINIIQKFENKVLRNIVNALWYIKNADLYRDLHMEFMTGGIKKFTRKHKERQAPLSSQHWSYPTLGQQWSSAQAQMSYTVWTCSVKQRQNIVQELNITIVRVLVPQARQRILTGTSG